MSTLADRIYAFLNEEGHVVETDGAIRNITRIHFRSRGLHFAVYVTRDDDRFLQVTCSMPIETGVAFDSGLLRALWTCQRHFRDVKYALTGDAKRFVCSTEIVLPGTTADEAVFWRAIGVVEAGLYAAMREIRARHMVKAAAEKFIAECLLPR